jgi:hypothetical protein
MRNTKNKKRPMGLTTLHRDMQGKWDNIHSFLTPLPTAPSG